MTLEWSDALAQARAAVVGGESPSEATWTEWVDAARSIPHEKITPASEVVYYLRFGDRIKIGYTAFLSQRLTAIPHDEVLAVERGDRHVERLRHSEWASVRVRGEWFHATPELLAHCQRVRKEMR